MVKQQAEGGRDGEQHKRAPMVAVNEGGKELVVRGGLQPKIETRRAIQLLEGAHDGEGERVGGDNDQE